MNKGWPSKNRGTVYALGKAVYMAAALFVSGLWLVPLLVRSILDFAPKTEAARTLWWGSALQFALLFFAYLSWQDIREWWHFRVLYLIGASLADPFDRHHKIVRSQTKARGANNPGRLSELGGGPPRGGRGRYSDSGSLATYERGLMHPLEFARIDLCRCF